MSFFENITNAIATIYSNKLRSSLTMLGIIIGVASVIVMIAIGQGAQAGVTSKIESMGTNLLIITPGSQSQTNVRSMGGGSSSTDTLTQDDLEILQKMDGIAGISAEYSSRKQVIYGSNNASVTVTGVLPAYEDVRNFHLSYGQFITDEENEKMEKVAVVGQDIVDDLFEGENPIGKDIKIEGLIFTVIGVMETKGTSMGQSQDNIVLIPLSTAQKRVFGSNSISTIYVSVEDANNMESMQENIEYSLYESHGITNTADADFTVINQADTLETISEVTGIFTMLLGGIAGISLLVGGIGVMNIMLVSVTERTREIGIRKAIGAMEKDILLQFLTESVILSVAGGSIGILISFFAASIISSNFDLETSITSSSIVLAFAFSASVGIFFGAFPAYKAGKMNPIDALRFE